MSHRSWLAWAGAALAAAALFGMGCSGPGVQRVTIVGGDLDLGLLEQRQLTVTVAATGGIPTTVDWTSTDPTVVTVNPDGLLTAMAFGAARVAATSTYDPSKSHDVEVQVILTGGHVWTHQFGTAARDTAWDIAIHDDGSFVVAGLTDGTLFDPGSPPTMALYALKLDDDGTTVWAHQLGPVTYPLGGAAAGPDGRTAVVATTADSLDGQPQAGGEDAFVRVLDADGAAIWSRQFGTADDDGASSVAIDAGGNVIVAGTTFGALDGLTHAGAQDAFVRKHTSEGVHLWTRQFGTAATEWIMDMAVGSDGRIAVIGATLGDLDGWSNAGGSDAFVRVFDAEGVHLWTHLIGTPAGEEPCAVTIDQYGHVLAAGLTGGTLPGQTTAGAADAFVRKLAHDGTVLWTRQFGSDAEDMACGVATDHEGHVLVSGYTLGVLPGAASSGRADAFVRRWDADGQEVWTQQFGTAEDDYGYRVAIDAAGFAVITGDTYGALGAPSAGDADAFVRRLRP